MKIVVPGRATPKPADEPLEYRRCEHPAHTVCRRTQSNGVVVVVRQCRVCGANAGNLQKALYDVPSLPAFDEEKPKAWWAAQQKRWDDARAERHVRFQAWYSAYLLSPEWRARRDAAMNRDQHLCQGCRRKAATQVHHLTYARVGRELLIDLTSLCDECHDAAHTD